MSTNERLPRKRTFAREDGRGSTESLQIQNVNFTLSTKRLLCLLKESERKFTWSAIFPFHTFEECKEWYFRAQNAHEMLTKFGNNLTKWYCAQKGATTHLYNVNSVYR